MKDEDLRQRQRLVVAAHAVLLAVPVALIGRASALVQIRSLVCIALLLLLSFVEIRFASCRNDGSLEAPAKLLALASSLALLGIGWSSIATTTPSPLGSWSYAGAILAIVGIALRACAMRHLGPRFTSRIRPLGKSLVVEGIYGWVRHPSELGFLMIGGGIAFFGGSAIAVLLGALILVPSIAVRVIREERALSAEFGATHARYRARVGAVAPRHFRC